MCRQKYYFFFYIKTIPLFKKIAVFTGFPFVATELSYQLKLYRVRVWFERKPKNSRGCFIVSVGVVSFARKARRSLDLFFLIRSLKFSLGFASSFSFLSSLGISEFWVKGVEPFSMDLHSENRCGRDTKIHSSLYMSGIHEYTNFYKS